LLRSSALPYFFSTRDKTLAHRMPEYPYNSDIGQTDLMGAAYNGDADEVLRILAMPCDIDAQDTHGMTALMYAALSGHNEVVKCLIEHKAVWNFSRSNVSRHLCTQFDAVIQLPFKRCLQPKPIRMCTLTRPRLILRLRWRRDMASCQS